MLARLIPANSVLRIQTYRRIFISRFISNLGNGIAPIALAFGVLAIPGTDATSLSIVLAAQAIPLILVLPFGGVIADRLGRAKVIALSDTVLGVVVMTIAVLFFTDSATVLSLAILGAIAGCLNGLWWPAYAGMVPDAVEDEFLQPANAYLSIASNGGLILGSALGGILVALFGPGLAIAIDASSFLISAWLIFTIRHIAKPHDSGESMLGDLAEGWRVFISYRWVVVIVAAFSVVLLAGRGSLEVLGPVLAVEHYGGAAGWSAVLACESLGLLLGAFLVSKLQVKRPMVFAMSLTFALPVLLVFLSLALPLWLIALAALALGIAYESLGVLWFTALQTHIPRESLSRVSAYDAMGSLMLGPLGLALAGPLAAAIGLQGAFLIAAITAFLAIAASLAAPSVRKLAA
ncbi:unannotated protein [freshwater metagenome]|uniref:Unannotated protein n=1 Tax=freshwater metagenome TaxID=449393 RepID=A0A6J7FIX0_9ZZZZ|nr:MFS transporter [Actinomycetota bacterium]